MKWIFETVAEGQLKTEQVIQQALNKGLKSCKSNIWLLLRNPVYCGRIYVAGYKDESPKHVPGLHEPLIPESLFYKVQDILDGKNSFTELLLGHMIFCN